MGPWKGFWNLLGFTWRVKAKVDFGGNAATDISGVKPADIGWTPDGGVAEGSHAKTRRREKVGDGPSCAVTQRRFVAMRVSWSAPA
jgi:hypothetical protein